MPCNLAVTLLLAKIDRLDGFTADIGNARFDFDKAIRIPFERDDVCFTEGGLEVALQNFISVPFEVFYCEVFAFSPENFSAKVFRCILHSPLFAISPMCSAVP